MFVGIGVMGYFHLKSIKLSQRFGKSLLLCLVGIVLFSVIYFAISDFLPGFFFLIIPLAGGVLGFNFRLVDNSAD